ncbi:iron ABC transporter permease [Nisaea acidiphila]|uniref:Iron ABC transporter permease n=1 Tax=Nisaea acidiphila TaxID=1862145 RepID=A0A9J7AZC1_9PROT|nr:iron ABC transporter permease [Nisaea acidiphila]UUX51604.1 iron ABC transporter permease [Nisaea acidiphila]
MTDTVLPEAESLRSAYFKSRRRKLLCLALLSVLMSLCFVADILIGSQGLGLDAFLKGLLGTEISRESVIVWQIRMPGAVMALLIGMALAMSGVQMQTVLNNPLADPFTLGLSSAAGFGAAMAIVLDKSIVSILPVPSEWFVAANAFLFSLATVFLISTASRVRDLTPETVTLLGIAVMFAFNALLTLMQYMASADQLQELIFWMMGSLAKASWNTILILAVILLLIAPLLLRNAWQLTAIQAHEQMAQVRGVSTERLRLSILILVSFLTAISVAFVGTIGFIGLVAPHTARLLIGEEQRWLMPATLLVGAIFMSATSLISKAAIPGVILPIGVITALIGIPFFLALVMARQPRRS